MISIAGIAQAGPFVNVYAYSQAFLGGVNPGATEEGGGQVKVIPKEKLNYYFYVEYLPKEKFAFTILWIKGQPFRVRTDSILQTPVHASTEDIGVSSTKTVLVPATNNKVLRLFPADQLKISAKPPGWLRKMQEKNEIFIGCKWKGKIWYYSVPKIKVLEAIAGV